MVWINSKIRPKQFELQIYIFLPIKIKKMWLNFYCNCYNLKSFILLLNDFPIFVKTISALHSAQLYELDDNALISHYKETENNAVIGVLFERYTHLAFGVCMKYLKSEQESKDAVMQIFEKLITDLLKHEVQTFRFWLHTVCRNHCLMQLRAEQSLGEKKKEFKKDLPIIMENHSMAHHIQKEIELKHLSEAIKSLKDEQKICVELFYLKEKSYQEVAEITGFSLLNVKSYIQNGKRNLKLFLEKKNEFRTT